MPVTRLFDPHVQAAGVAGDPLVGASLYTYIGPATLTPQVAYVDSAGTTAATNPIVANAAGRWATLYLDAALTYRVRAVDAAGNVIFDVVDAAPTVDDTPASGALRPEDFETGVDDGVTDAADALRQAAEASAVVRLSAGKTYLIDTSVDLPEGTTIQRDPGSKLKIAAGVTLFAPSGKVIGQPQSGLIPADRIFDCEAGGNIVGLTTADPTWWGADASMTSAEDSAPAFEAAWDCLYRIVDGKTTVRDRRRLFTWSGMHTIDAPITFDMIQAFPVSVRGSGIAGGIGGGRLAVIEERTFTATPSSGNVLLTLASATVGGSAVANIQDHILPGRRLTGSGIATGALVARSLPDDPANSIRMTIAANGSPGAVTITAAGFEADAESSPVVFRGATSTTILDFDCGNFDVVNFATVGLDPCDYAVIYRNFQSIGNILTVGPIYTEGFKHGMGITESRQITLDRVQLWCERGQAGSRALRIFGGLGGFTGDIVGLHGSQFVVKPQAESFAIEISNDIPFFGSVAADGQPYAPEVRGVRLAGVAYRGGVQVKSTNGGFVGEIFLNFQIDGQFGDSTFEVTSDGEGSLTQGVELETRYIRGFGNVLGASGWEKTAIKILSTNGGDTQQVIIEKPVIMDVEGTVVDIGGVRTSNIHITDAQCVGLNGGTNSGGAPIETDAAIVIKDGANNVFVSFAQAQTSPHARSFGAGGTNGTNVLNAYNAFTNKVPLYVGQRITGPGVPFSDATGESVVVIKSMKARVTAVDPAADVAVLVGGSINGQLLNGTPANTSDLREIQIEYRNHKTGGISDALLSGTPTGLQTFTVQNDQSLMDVFVHIKDTAGSNINVSNTQVASIARTIVKDDRSVTLTGDAAWTSGSKKLTFTTDPLRDLNGWRVTAGGGFPANTHVMFRFGAPSPSWDRNTNRDLN